MRGSKYASVLPQPVSAASNTLLPARIGLIPCTYNNESKHKQKGKTLLILIKIVKIKTY